MRKMLLLAALVLFSRPSMAQDSENKIRGEVSGRATALFARRDFEGLSKLADQYRASGEKTPGGVSKLSLFYAGIATLPLGPYAADGEWQAIFMFAEDWIRVAPSPAPYIARAEMNIRYAWQQRGADGATNPEREKSFRSHIRTAHQQLDDCKAVAQFDPEWTAAMERVRQAEKLPNALDAPRMASAPLVIPHDTAYSLTDEINIRANIEVQARLLFEQGKFSELNALAHRFVDGERTPAGTQKLPYFYEGLLAYARFQTPSLVATPNENGWHVMFSRAQDWIDKSPSPAAYITLAKFHYEFGWAWRGNGFSNTVRPDAWEPYREQLTVARDILTAHKAEADSDPEWYATMENLALEQNWSQSESQTLYGEALTKHRYYDPVYYAIGTRLEPKWGGSWEAVEKFADVSARATKSKMGDILYTRIYQRAVKCRCRMFGESQVNWVRMKAGFEEMLGRFPDPWNANRFAYFACLAEDKPTAKAILASLPKLIIPAWDGGEGAYQQCKAWVAAA